MFYLHCQIYGEIKRRLGDRGPYYREHKIWNYTHCLKIQREESKRVTQIYSSTPYSSYRWCYMVMQGTNRKLILIQMVPSERFGRFGPVLEIQLLKGSKFVVLKSVEKSLFFTLLKPVSQWIGGYWEITTSIYISILLIPHMTTYHLLYGL